jgi:hypothetical protein
VTDAHFLLVAAAVLILATGAIILGRAFRGTSHQRKVDRLLDEILIGRK